MSDEPRTIAVRIDSEFHGGKEPRDEVERLIWEILDTAWNLLREGAVRVTIAELNSQLSENGVEFRLDPEQIFAENADNPDAPRSYMDLAPQKGDGESVELAGMSLQAAFELLAQQTFADAASGMGLAIGGE